MKKLIIILALISLTGCASFQGSTSNRQYSREKMDNAMWNMSSNNPNSPVNKYKRKTRERETQNLLRQIERNTRDH